ncbi:Stk1 family PASTA domain-containing Ser/Thr kinase [Ruminiclostridium herbifermentans]|uniref:non-specific serine/threonine protein kinase n=1 Tax=Ruminiclostridium herbifermentans TaxID=2488810 RepID=A0A4U7JBN8_9FIRM|nr:Stk1 family PASTA domain-containing Ser/Thr kinase [Ruminiclostridium herbifermentans]QNU65597.1 Stk1 family PASTA domain-containing Ser/Thr kinase [Ruminiclostridium herbifermentans]
MEGQVLGNRYTLLEKIGGGGMAVVYKSKDTLLNRFVAIKVLRAEFSTDEEFVKRFNVEAQSVASLSHPNVVSIYDVGYQNNIHYIVMEYVDGLTLKEYINKNGALDWQEAIKISIQICSAIEHAHKNNIVHRDIKPHNILMTKEGIAKVTDFGIARAVTSSTITMVGSTIGSVHYFSPEQARGGFIDDKSDLYSLGIVMYEMVTGRVPFDGDSPVAVALKHIQEIPPEPRKFMPSLPYGVNEIINKAVQKDQSLRYQSATAMIVDLNKVLVRPQGGFVGQNVASNQATIRMQPLNNSNIPNHNRNNTTNNYMEAKKQNKKNTTAYWLAGITSVLVIAIALFFTISLLSKGNKETYEIGNYKGKNFSLVEEELIAKGINYTEIWQENDDYEKGIILEQSLPAGTTYRDGKYTNLELIISKGPQMAKVPDVVEREKREAENEIKTAGLTSKFVNEYNDDIPAGYVIKTEPAADKELKVGSEVVIYVSNGTELKTVKVPNLVGKTETEAEKLLAESKLVLGKIIPAGVTKGIVDRQLPAAFEDVTEGDSVTIFLTPQDTAPPTDVVPPSDTTTNTEETGQKPADESSVETQTPPVTDAETIP